MLIYYIITIIVIFNHGFCSQKFGQDNVDVAYLCSVMFGASAGELKGWNPVMVCLFTYKQLLITS